MSMAASLRRYDNARCHFGVCGTCKTSLAPAPSAWLGILYVDGNNLHPISDVAG